MADDRDIRRRIPASESGVERKGTRRLWAASEAKGVGRGGITAVARATGVSRRAIGAGLRELKDRRGMASERTRRPGGGRKRITQTDPRLLDRLDCLVEPVSRGDPMSPLRWTCQSVRNLAGHLTRRGHPVSYRTVASLLHAWATACSPTARTPRGRPSRS